MKNFITLVIINVTSIFTMSLVAQDATNDKINELTEVVVVASKFPVKIENTGRSVVNIDQSTLEKLPFQTVASLLTQITGIEINGSQNAAGKNLGYYVRGGRSHQLLILIDGIPVTDAS
ncbi:MAG: TonB-dependent receptor plug domain-containing protein, partial [Bacteroidetes bacterium]|nr:TonB-dependent receptor plug domain-containing protein [Bacteroidota bacterium]